MNPHSIYPREDERFYISNGTIGHWVDVYMSDATPQPPPATPVLPIPPAAETPKSQVLANATEARVSD